MVSIALPLAVLAAPPQEKLKVFDASSKTIIVNGDSTSFQWPRILQRKIDAAGKDGRRRAQKTLRK